MGARWSRVLIVASVLATLSAAGTAVVVADTGGVITSVVSTRGDLMCSAAPTSIYTYSHALLSKDQITSSAIFNDTLEENVTFAYQRVTVQVDGASVGIG